MFKKQPQAVKQPPASKVEGGGAIDWSDDQFNLAADPAVAAAQQVVSKLFRRKQGLEKVTSNYVAAIRTQQPISPIKRKAEALLAEAEGGVAVADDDRPTEAQYQKDCAELRATEEALKLANEKLQEAKRLAGNTIRKRLNPHRREIVTKMHGTVTAMVDVMSELRDFQNQLSRMGLVGASGDADVAFPWQAVYIHNVLFDRLTYWLDEYNKHGFEVK